MKGWKKKSCLFLTQKETTFRMTDKYPFSDVKVAQIADKGKVVLKSFVKIKKDKQ